ncbi:hypothetical protein A1D29_03240 [Pasteurellaceae bacterium Orientalotternb1]|nr:hypothetical protein A1D29_03240 [Pasteurellaceae bacterium Orientalotternb1]
MQLIQILSDVGAGKRGSHEGVKWLSQRSDAVFERNVIFENNLPSDFTTPPAKYIDNLTAFFHQFLPLLSQCFQSSSFPVILSGDHANAIGTISALCHAFSDKRIGVIWIDAHTDLHTPYTTPSGNLHGMSLAALTRQDNKPFSKHSLSDKIGQYWQQLKQLAPQSKGILPNDLCFLGVRDCEPEEVALLNQFHIPYFSVEKIREMGIEQVLTQVKQQFDDVDLVYLSFDVDALDADLLSATGTPVKGGFTEQEVNWLLRELLHLPSLAVFELTEFNPTLSSDTIQYERVGRLFKSALMQIEKREMKKAV